MAAHAGAARRTWNLAAGELRRWLDLRRNRDGGWGYRPGRPSRLEPTCWALIAKGAADTAVLERWPRHEGLPVEGPSGAVNIAFAGLAAFTRLCAAAHPPDDCPDVRVLGSVHGITLPPYDVVPQNNDLRGWPWVDDTFSWVEPTAWCLLALKCWRRLGGHAPWLAQRVGAGDALLADRAIPTGGWNYGNPRVYGKVLPAFVPTTALALLALGDRSRDAAAVRGLTWLAGHQLAEASGSAMGLAAICLDRFGVDVGGLRNRLVKGLDAVLDRGDVVAAGQVCAGLEGGGPDGAFAV